MTGEGTHFSPPSRTKTILELSEAGAQITLFEARLSRLEVDQRLRLRYRRQSVFLLFLLLASSAHLILRSDRARVSLHDLSHGLLRCCSDQLSPDIRASALRFSQSTEVAALFSFGSSFFQGLSDVTVILMQDFVLHLVFDRLGLQVTLALGLLFWFIGVPLLWGKKKSSSEDSRRAEKCEAVLSPSEGAEKIGRLRSESRILLEEIEAEEKEERKSRGRSRSPARFAKT